MPYRRIVFADKEIYHVVGRGVAQSPIFRDVRDYRRALESIDFYRCSETPVRFSHFNRLPDSERNNFFEKVKNNNKSLIEIIAFCLMPNHIHFLLRQLEENGVSTFMRNFQNSYARYFNTKYNRIGSLFQTMFRAVWIESEEQLLHVSRYIHLNPVSSFLIKIDDLDNFLWSSFPTYRGITSLKFISPGIILNYFKSKRDYQKFVLDQAEYQKELEKIKHLTLEK